MFVIKRAGEPSLRNATLTSQLKDVVCVMLATMQLGNKKTQDTGFGYAATRTSKNANAKSTLGVET